MPLHKGLTQVYLQKKPGLHFGESFTLTSTDMLVKYKEVSTYLILPPLHNSVINHNRFTDIPEPVYLCTLPSLPYNSIIIIYYMYNSWITYYL